MIFKMGGRPARKLRKKGLGVFLLAAALCFSQEGFAAKEKEIPSEVPGTEPKLKLAKAVKWITTPPLEMTGMGKSLEKVPPKKVKKTILPPVEEKALPRTAGPAGQGRREDPRVIKGFNPQPEPPGVDEEVDEVTGAKL